VISHLDHLVLTTANEAACIDFYTRVTGMAMETFIGGTPPVERKAFKFGGQKINVHIKSEEFEPKANVPTPGSLDLCFISKWLSKDIPVLIIHRSSHLDVANSKALEIAGVTAATKDPNDGVFLRREGRRRPTAHWRRTWHDLRQPSRCPRRVARFDARPVGHGDLRKGLTLVPSAHS
jgi:catechol 2,3-dioxygenase-like lactoylglutathione lyase family enzyme